MIRLVRKINEVVSRAARAAATWLARRLRKLWAEHIDRLSNNAAYAAAAGAIVGGLLGFMPARDVLAAVLAAVLGVSINGARPTRSAMNRWTDPWDVE